MWAGIRRYASLESSENLSGLMQFLRDEDHPKTQQAALQAVASAFVHEPSLTARSVMALCSRVREVAAHATLRLNEPVYASLALHALCAAAALRDPETDNLLIALAERGKKHLTERAREMIATLRRELAAA